MVRDHRLIACALVLALVPRVLASLAFRPALFTPDSFGYMTQALNPTPGQWHPAGYPVLLLLLLPFHSLLLVTAVQHLLGLATAVLGYAVLRQWGLPAWGAVLTACPVLFDTRQVALESSVLPDTLYAALLMLAVSLLLARRGPSVARYAVAGLLFAWAAVTRGNGAPEIAAAVLVMLAQRAGWRAITACACAFALPVLGYMGVFAARNGNFALTDSGGMFLWSRTMSFADCAVIKPTPSLRPLCPQPQPGHPPGPAPAWSATALLQAPSPASYLWAPGVWWRQGPRPGFTAANNARAMRFALAAIRAQPTAYLRTVASGVALTFVATDRPLTARTLAFTSVPDVPRLDRHQRAHLYAYAHTGSTTHPVQPYAYFLYLYQEPVYFPGVVFGLVIAAGLAGVIRRRRRGGGPAALPWAVAVAGIVIPVAVHEYHYRYAISVVPLACLAAGLAFARIPAQRPAPAVATGRPLAAEIITPAPAFPAAIAQEPTAPPPTAPGPTTVLAGALDARPAPAPATHGRPPAPDGGVAEPTATPALGQVLPSSAVPAQYRADPSDPAGPAPQPPDDPAPTGHSPSGDTPS